MNGAVCIFYDPVEGCPSHYYAEQRDFCRRHRFPAVAQLCAALLGILAVRMRKVSITVTDSILSLYRRMVRFVSWGWV